MTPANSIQKLVREQRFDLPSSSYRIDMIRDILIELGSKKFTGKVTVNMSQGGVQSVTAEDSARVSPPPAGRIFRGEAENVD